MTAQAPPSWHPDPFGRYEMRYWDGFQWTHYVVTRGQQSIDAPVFTPPPPAAMAPHPQAARPVDPVDRKVERVIRQSGVASATHTGGGTPITEPVLFVSQKAKFIEVNAEYAIFDQHARRIGSVREIGQNLLKKAAGIEGFTTRRLQVLDAGGAVLFTLTQAPTVLKAKVVLRDIKGVEIGHIAQKTLGLISNFQFNLIADDEILGTLNGEGWNTWNFNITDARGAEAGRVTKKWAGNWSERFTKADNYMVEIQPWVEGPLRTLAVASALAIDTVLRQGDSNTDRRRRRR